MATATWKDLEKGDHEKNKIVAEKHVVPDKTKEEEKPDIPWSQKSAGQQGKAVLWVFARIVILVGCLYIFICSLGLLEDSFQLLGGKAAGKTFQNSDLLSNPIAGLMIGVLATVLVQSSSTSTSIVITMVGSEIIPIRTAIPIIMGANIGTSVTNTLVSLAQASDRTEFRRAFSGATVHDMFNWLSVLVLLPLEVAVHYLDWLTGLIVDSLHLQTQGKAPDMLKAITKPLTTLVVEVDKDVIKKTASGDANATTDDDTVLKRWCDVTYEPVNVTSLVQLDDVTVNCQKILTSNGTAAPSLFALCQQASQHELIDLTNVSARMTFDSIDQVTQEKKLSRCDNLFAQSELSDSAAGGILLVCSLILIFLALYGLVKVLHSVLHGSLAKVIKKFINADLPGKAAYFTGYIFILIGCGMTMILQSSSVFTSTLTPMVGVGVVTVERMYPLTLGSNIGTTLTGILAALSQEGDHLKDALHVALCHLFFNLSGILLFYPIPFMRLPIGMAKALGRTTSKHRWFAIAYLLLLFVVLPGAVFGLSVAGWLYLAVIGGPLLMLFLLVLVINVLQRKRPRWLPRPLRTWDFLPLCLHSLKPVDSLVAKVCVCGCCQRIQEADLGDGSSIEDKDDHEDNEDKDKKKEKEEDVECNEGACAPYLEKPSQTKKTKKPSFSSQADVEEEEEQLAVAVISNGHVAHENRRTYDNSAFEMETHRL